MIDLPEPRVIRAWLDECRLRFEQTKTSDGQARHGDHLAVNRPDWLADGTDRLRELFAAMPRLWREGIVVWGHLIQANYVLFAPGELDCPGELVIALDRDPHIDPIMLQSIARLIGDLKHRKPVDPQLAPISHYLADERTRVFGAEVPKSIRGPFRCCISTTFFVRRHLPQSRIGLGLMPVVVLPAPPHYAMMLPWRFWPKALTSFWIADAPRPTRERRSIPTFEHSMWALLAVCCARTGRNTDTTGDRIQKVLNQAIFNVPDSEVLREYLNERDWDPLHRWMHGPFGMADLHQRQFVYDAVVWLFNDGHTDPNDMVVLRELANVLSLEPP